MATLKSSFPASKPGKAQTGKGKAAAATHTAAAAAADSAEQEYEQLCHELKLFDFDSRFGPYLGMTRLQRWERAAANGLSPPPHIKQVLLEHAADERLKWSVLENLVTSHPKVAA